MLNDTRKISIGSRHAHFGTKICGMPNILVLKTNLLPRRDDTMIFFFKVLLLLFSSVRKIHWTGPGFNKSAESFGFNLQTAMKTVKATCIVLSCNVILAFLTYKLKTRRNTPWWLWREAPNFRIRQLVGTLFAQASLWDTSMIWWIGKVLFCCFSLNKNLRSSFNWKMPASTFAQATLVNHIWR